MHAHFGTDLEVLSAPQGCAVDQSKSVASKQRPPHDTELKPMVADQLSCCRVFPAGCLGVPGDCGRGGR
jgi:hypothetical protein